MMFNLNVKLPEAKKIHSISTDRINWDFFSSNNSLFHFIRSDNNLDSSSIIDVFPDRWHLFIGESDSLNIYDSKHCNSSELTAVFIPPFEPVKWHVKKGRHTWVGFFSDIFFENFPKKPVSFTWDSNWTLTDPKDLSNYFSSGIELTSFEYEKSVSKLAKYCKQKIDQSFEDNFSLSDLAKKQGLSCSALSQSFKKSFEITPNHYLSRLRLMKSINLIFAQKLSNTDSCYDGGFGDYSRFGRICNDTFEIPPSKFRVP